MRVGEVGLEMVCEALMEIRAEILLLVLVLLHWEVEGESLRGTVAAAVTPNAMDELKLGVCVCVGS